MGNEMENKLPINEINADTVTVQEYADLYCGGDRFRAIYELLDCEEKGSFDRHIDDLSQEEARFVLWFVRDAANIAYGGQAAFNKAVKANALAESLGVEIDDLQPDTPNPFAKKLRWSILSIFAAIAITVLISVINKHFNANISYIGEVLIGLAAMSVAGHITQFFRFRKLKKLAATLPTTEMLNAKTYSMPPFEEAFALFRQSNTYLPEIEKDEAERLLRNSRRQLGKTLLWSVGYLFAIMISVFAAFTTGIVGGIIGSLGLIAFGVWQMITLYRSLLKSKAVGNVKNVDEQQQKRMDTRQSLYALAAICLTGLYLILALIGCLTSIMITL